MTRFDDEEPEAWEQDWSDWSDSKAEVCDYCAGAFDVRDELVEAGEALAGAYLDHPSIAAHVGDGFAVWIL